MLPSDIAFPPNFPDFAYKNSGKTRLKIILTNNWVH